MIYFLWGHHHLPGDFFGGDDEQASWQHTKHQTRGATITQTETSTRQPSFIKKIWKYITLSCRKNKMQKWRPHQRQEEFRCQSKISCLHVAAHPLRIHISRWNYFAHPIVCSLSLFHNFNVFILVEEDVTEEFLEKILSTIIHLGKIQQSPSTSEFLKQATSILSQPKNDFATSPWGHQANWQLSTVWLNQRRTFSKLKMVVIFMIHQLLVGRVDVGCKKFDFGGLRLDRIVNR